MKTNPYKELKKKYEDNLVEMLTGHCVGVESIVEEKGLLWRLRPSYTKFVGNILWSFIESALKEAEKKGREEATGIKIIK